MGKVIKNNVHCFICYIDTKYAHYFVMISSNKFKIASFLF